MKQDATLIRARLQTPRAAIAGILFSALLITGPLGVTCRFVKNCTLSKGRGRCKGVPERSQLPISQAAVATPIVVTGQVDVFPFQR
jgi:hypothetical protein